MSLWFLAFGLLSLHPFSKEISGCPTLQWVADTWIHDIACRGIHMPYRQYQVVMPVPWQLNIRKSGGTMSSVNSYPRFFNSNQWSSQRHAIERFANAYPNSYFLSLSHILFKQNSCKRLVYWCICVCIPILRVRAVWCLGYSLNASLTIDCCMAF